MSASTVSMGIAPLDSDINSITAVAQAQSNTGGGSGSSKLTQKRIAGKGSNLHPINEDTRESSTNGTSSVSENSKTVPVKKVERTQKGKGLTAKAIMEKEKAAASNGLVHKQRNVSNMSVAKSKSSSMTGSKINARRKQLKVSTILGVHLLYSLKRMIMMKIST